MLSSRLGQAQMPSLDLGQKLLLKLQRIRTVFLHDPDSLPGASYPAQ